MSSLCTCLMNILLQHFVTLVSGMIAKEKREKDDKSFSKSSLPVPPLGDVVILLMLLVHSYNLQILHYTIHCCQVSWKLCYWDEHWNLSSFCPILWNSSFSHGWRLNKTIYNVCLFNHIKLNCNVYISNLYCMNL